jgi:hypothetical protein
VQLAELRRLAAERERGGAGSVVEREQLSGAVEQVREGRRLRWQAQQPVELR